MKKHRISDLAASVRQRLQNNAKETGRLFQEVLQYFAMERFLYRLSESPHVENFILKGALMFVAWHAPASRPTKDIDFLARMCNSADSILPVVREICTQSVEPDGLVFDLDSIEGKLIKEDVDYEGLRVTFTVRLQNARIAMQLDMGFGDVLTPSAELTDYPTILDFSHPRLYGYPRETVIAEKFEAMVKLGQLNSRMKDFFDILLLSRQYEFSGVTLASAIAKTFSRRKTPLDLPPVAFSESFTSHPQKTVQWSAFLRKSKLAAPAVDFSGAIADIRGFLLPPAEAARDNRPFPTRWSPPGRWLPL